MKNIKIKSFCVGTVKGIGEAYEKLDKLSQKSLDFATKVTSVTDTVHFQPEVTKCNKTTPGNPKVTRVIVYEVRNASN